MSIFWINGAEDIDFVSWKSVGRLLSFYLTIVNAINLLSFSLLFFVGYLLFFCCFFVCSAVSLMLMFVFTKFRRFNLVSAVEIWCI